MRWRLARRRLRFAEIAKALQEECFEKVGAQMSQEHEEVLPIEYVDTAVEFTHADVFEQIVEAQRALKIDEVSKESDEIRNAP